MFGNMFTTLVSKITLGLALAAVALCVFLYFEKQSTEKDLKAANTTISENNTKIATLQGTVDNLNKQIEISKLTQRINDDTRSNVATETKGIVKNNQTVSQIARTRINAIESTYAAKPQTPENIAAKDLEVSRTRMNALSAVFCNSNPNDPSCVGGTLTSPAVPASAATSAASM